MDEATQQNTQPVDHLRTKGASSVLKTQDEADILCFLHPASLPAHKAVDLVLNSTPQHVHMSHAPSSDPHTSANNELENSDSDNSDIAIPDTRVISPDIALRMSSQVRDRRMGFVFGRNLSKCDLLMAEDSMRLSSAHFRVYVNHGGVLMLEDMSKNGTYVDHHLLKSLKADPPNHGLPSTRMLSQGSIIELPVIAEKNEEWIRFIVSFPSRKNGEDVYQANLVDYIQWIKQDERKVQIAKAAGIPLPAVRPMPFTPLQKTARAQSPPNSTITAATGQNNFGMKWNGGEIYNVVGHIGQGAFAMVFKLSTVQDGSVYACKQIEKRRFVKDGQPGQKMHDEIRIMESISHPSIVQFVDYHETSRFMFIIMEYVPLGDLTVYTNESMMMYEHMGQHVAAQICQALKYLHEHKIAHRDIKPDNVLVANHTPFVFKLSDFGLSKIVSSEDNMRTFCGTILYCAPEIYPGYERAKAGMPVGKRGRHIQHPREETRPYYYSVDTWGIAAVLFHLLSGQPAWAGTTDDNGAVMLENIFSTPIDWERMTLAGLSDLAIDFIERMLQIDPADRATDEEILAHPWINKLVLGDHVQLNEEANAGKPTTHDDEELPDASQLEINDKHDSHGLDGTNERELDQTLNQIDNAPSEKEHDPLGIQDRILYPRTSLSNLATRHAPVRHQPNARLFGEIPEAALQSSGILGQNVNEALEIQEHDMKEDEDLEYEEFEHDDEMEGLDMDYEHEEVYTFSREQLDQAAAAADAVVLAPLVNREHSGLASVEDDFRGSDETSAKSDSDAVTADGDTKVVVLHQIFPQNSNIFHDPRIVGTEDPTEDLDMVSTRRTRFGSSASASKEGSSPSTAGGNKSTFRQSKRSSQHLQTATDAASSKRSKVDFKAASEHQPGDLPLKENEPARSSHLLGNKDATDVEIPPGEELTAEEVAQLNAREFRSDEERERYLKALSEPSSFEMHEVSKTVTHGYRIRTDPDELYIAIGKSNKWKAAHPERVHPGKAELIAAMTAKRPKGPPPIGANTGPNLNTMVDPYMKLEPYKLDTPITLGVLTPIQGSIPTVAAITITNRTTTFGRDPTRNTFVHPGDPTADNWERVGRNCIDLTFWYRNIEKEIDDKTLPTDWYLNPDLTCLISTRTTRYILVNGVRLERGKIQWDYGKLRTGDIVTVVEPDPDREPRNESETMSLSFRCEFFTGKSKDPRPADGSDPFEVDWEYEEYDKNQDRIAIGFACKNRAATRARLIAEGRDPDKEAAERAEKRRVLRQQRKEKEEEEERGHLKRMRARGLISPSHSDAEKEANS